MEGTPLVPTNRLALERSPYLLQHAHNPVDWYPWGEEAFARAREENKLVLVSIGYSACHWCHVMERECFEDPDIAKEMGRFVCIKVDREERPDVDHVYMAAVQLMSGRGGWPLNCFALPNGRPVYGGTYFPPVQWKQLLEGLAHGWATEPERYREQAARVQQHVARTQPVEPVTGQAPFVLHTLRTGIARWQNGLDNLNGGPDRAPKFALPANYAFLLRYAQQAQDEAMKAHVVLTLDRMAHGGLFDQIGGGFYRYSTDAEWKVPHFEKMLYDNAQLIALYSQAYCAHENTLYRDVALRTIAFAERELQAPDGVFYSAVDADSEGEEGKFYCWTQEEIQEVLHEDTALACAYYGIGAEALWEHGRNIPLRPRMDADLAKQLGISADELRERVERVNDRLLTRRNERVRPATDTKCLTAWNALMVSAYCHAHAAFGQPAHLAHAQHLMAQVLRGAIRPDGGTWRDLQPSMAAAPPRVRGTLEDVTCTITALLDLYCADFQPRWLSSALALAEHALEQYLDTATGMFHFTSNADPELFARPMEHADNVIPASNSMMARALNLLGEIMDRPDHSLIAVQQLRNIIPHWESYPSAHGNWAMLLMDQLMPSYTLRFHGPNANTLRLELNGLYLPNVRCIPTVAAPETPQERRTFFVACTGSVCSAPLHSPQDLLQVIA
jgi:uncharacterized protein